MKVHEQVPGEKMKLLIQEIFNLRLDLSNIFIQKGPASSEYIELSIKLESLLKTYYEEQLLKLIGILKDELIELWIQQGSKHYKTTEASQKLDQIIIQYQKLKNLG